MDMQQVSLRAKYETKYERARANLLLMLILTVVNVVLMIVEADISFLFSAILPQVAINYGWFMDAWLGVSTYTSIAYVISLIFIGLMALCYFLSKKHRGWMIAAFCLFIVDCLALVYWVYLGFVPEDLLDIAFHIWMMVYMISGVIAFAKLKKLPPLPEGMTAAQAMSGAYGQQPYGQPMQQPYGQQPYGQPVQPQYTQQPQTQPQYTQQPPVQPQYTQSQAPQETVTAPVQQPYGQPVQPQYTQQPPVQPQYTQPEPVQQESAATPVQQPTEPERQPNFGPQPPMGPQPMDGEQNGQ